MASSEQDFMHISVHTKRTKKDEKIRRMVEARNVKP
jgi:hypothetical protein